jgi:hypothetical protein
MSRPHRLDHPVRREHIAAIANGGHVTLATQAVTVAGEGGDKSLADAGHSTLAPRAPVSAHT